MPAYIRAETTVSLGELDEEEYEIQCPDCRTHYTPRDPITHDFVLMKGKLYTAACPECEHVVIVRQLAESIDDA